MKRSKYRNVKTNGYDSGGESRRAATLKLLLKAGEISNLREQVKYQLAPAYYVQGINGKPVCVLKEVVYIADFVYIVKGETKDTVEDFKGMRTAVYRKKKRLMKSILGIDIKETSSKTK